MTDIIPFGKYKGQEIEQVRMRDPQYLQWLTQQAWFQEKFAPVCQVVINNFAPPSEDTPAHNALQVKFLDDEYRCTFWSVANLFTRDEREQLLQCFRGNTRDLRRAPKPFEYIRRLRDVRRDTNRTDSWIHDMLKLHRERVRRHWATWRFVRRPTWPVWMHIGKPKFEGVTDVTFPVTVSIGNEALRNTGLDVSRNYRLGIEIKPSMGDDYPSVLRQIKRQQAAARQLDEQRPTHWFLLVDQFSTNAVTLDQVRQIFAQDNIRLVMVDEVREQE